MESVDLIDVQDTDVAGDREPGVERGGGVDGGGGVRGDRSTYCRSGEDTDEHTHTETTPTRRETQTETHRETERDTDAHRETQTERRTQRHTTHTHRPAHTYGRTHTTHTVRQDKTRSASGEERRNKPEKEVEWGKGIEKGYNGTELQQKMSGLLYSEKEQGCPDGVGIGSR